MSRVITDGRVIENRYSPPERSQPKSVAPAVSSFNPEQLMAGLSAAIVAGLGKALAQMPVPPAPVINIPKPEIKINSPVYVQPPDIKIPATTVNVPDQKAPIVNIEPANVTLQTNRPTKWKFTFHRDEFGRMDTAECEDISTRK